jgi:hypothetical protein
MYVKATRSLATFDGAWLELALGNVCCWWETWQQSKSIHRLQTGNWSAAAFHGEPDPVLQSQLTITAVHSIKSRPDLAPA